MIHAILKFTYSDNFMPFYLSSKFCTILWIIFRLCFLTFLISIILKSVRALVSMYSYILNYYLFMLIFNFLVLISLKYYYFVYCFSCYEFELLLI